MGCGGYGVAAAGRPRDGCEADLAAGDQAQGAEHPHELEGGVVIVRDRGDAGDEGQDDDDAVHAVPGTAQVRALGREEPEGDDLQGHLQKEEEGEHEVGVLQHLRTGEWAAGEGGAGRYRHRRPPVPSASGCCRPSVECQPPPPPVPLFQYTPALTLHQGCLRRMRCLSLFVFFFFTVHGLP